MRTRVCHIEHVEHRRQLGLVLPLWVKNAALFVYALDLLMALVSKGFRFAPYCRIAIFIASYGGMWNMLVVIARVLPDCVDAGLFLIAYILFSVWIATSTFDKGPEHQSPYMRDFKETLWTLMVLLSNNDYPSSMMPAYDINRMTFLFFALYLLLGMFVLMNLTFAVLYTAFMKRYIEGSCLNEDIKGKKACMDELSVGVATIFISTFMRISSLRGTSGKGFFEKL